MKRSLFKPIIGGILIGAAAFFAPFFLLKALLFFFIIGAIFRMFMWRRYYHGGPRYYMAHVDKIRTMSAEEYSSFKEKINKWDNHCGYGRWNNCGYDKYNCDYDNKNCETKENK